MVIQTSVTRISTLYFIQVIRRYYIKASSVSLRTIEMKLTQLFALIADSCSEREMPRSLLRLKYQK